MIGESNTSQLAALKEITPPADISWLPQTIGWKVIFFLLILFLLFKVYQLIDKYRKNFYRRDAINLIESIEYDSDNISDIPLILRRCALYSYNRRDISPLINSNWEEWLDSKSQKSNFSQSVPGILSAISYSSNKNISENDFKRLKIETITWIQNHRGQND